MVDTSAVTVESLRAPSVVLGVTAGHRPVRAYSVARGNMGLISIEHLLKPKSESEPSGPNLEYAPEFSELERAVQGKPEQRLGSIHIPSEPPDWSAVSKLCLSLFEQTCDLRVAMHLAHSLLHCHGYLGFADGVEVAAALIRDLWGSVHPELDHDDDDDPTMRITALAALASPPTLLALQSSPLAQLRGLGTVTLQDVRALAGGATPPKAATAISAQSLEAIFQEVELEALQAISTAVQRSIDGVDAIDNAFITHTGSRGADFAPLKQLLREVRNVLKPRLDARLAALSDAGEAPQDGV